MATSVWTELIQSANNTVARSIVSAAAQSSLVIVLVCVYMNPACLRSMFLLRLFKHCQRGVSLYVVVTAPLAPVTLKCNRMEEARL